MASFMKKGFIYLAVFGSVISMALISCKNFPLITYQPVDLNGKRKTNIDRNMVAYNKLMKDGSSFYIEFSRRGNNYYSQLSIDLLTLNPHKTMTIHNMEFAFDNKVEVLKLNRKIKLNQAEELFQIENSDTSKMTIYIDYISYEYNNIKVYLQKIFNKDRENIGETINLNLIISYSFDGGEVLTQEIKYNVEISEGRDAGASWLHKIFPGI
jgi:hypothetical protein